MRRDISIRAILNKEPVKSLLQQLSPQCHEPLQVMDDKEEVILDWPGDGTTPPEGLGTDLERYAIALEDERILGTVSGYSMARFMADFMVFLLRKERDVRLLTRETLGKYKELNVLYDLGEKISACVEYTDLIRLALDETKILLSHLDYFQAGIIITNETRSQARIEAGYGRSFPPGKHLESLDGITLDVLASGLPEIVNQLVEDRRFQDNAGEFSGITAMLSVPLKSRDKVFGLIAVVTDNSHEFKAADLKLLHLLATQIGWALGRMELVRLKLEQERLEESLKLARSIQMNMLPCQFPDFSESSPVDIHARMEPARQVGGDFYDFFAIDKSRLLLVIGDVSDKGIPAALFMVMAKTLIRASARVHDLPHAILAAVNPELCRDNDAMMFVTLFLATLNLESGLLTYSCAGHNPPLLLERDGTALFLTGDSGMALGVMDTAKFRDQHRILHTGECLLLYTDGVNEALNSHQEVFGEYRLTEVLKNSRSCNAVTLVNNIMSAVRQFAGSAEQSDDITLLAVCRQ